jgi:hypothetical protein
MPPPTGAMWRTERVMRWNVTNMIERAIASMPILMVSGALTKTGYPSWGLAWIAGICALLITADLFNSRRRDPAPL